MPRGRNRSQSPPRHRRRRHRSRSPRRDRSPRSEPRNSHRRGREMPKKNKIPDNWADVPKMGTIIGTSRFLPLRVPLDDKYEAQFQRKRDQIWTPRDFLEVQKSQNLNVKILIDLTNTFKYYDGEREFQDSGVEYVKLKIEGFLGPPSARDVAKFTEIVDNFVKQEPEGAVAVHCTHGLNRTGYLIVDYMVNRMQCTVTEALAAFKVARPPGLIKHMYVQELYKRLGVEEEVQLPELPDWASAKYSIRDKPRKEGKHRNRGRRGKKNFDSKEETRGSNEEKSSKNEDGAFKAAVEAAS